MRIVLIAGQARSFVNFRGPLIEALLRLGHEVSAVGPEAASDTLDWLSSRGVDYHVVPLSRASLNPVRDIRALLAIRSTLVAIQAQVVVAFTIKAVIYGLVAARLAGVSRRFAMITGLGYAFIDSGPSLKRSMVRRAALLMYRLSLTQAELVIFQNPDDLSMFRQLKVIGPRHRVGVVNGSGVDLEHFLPVPLPTDPVCLMIARLLEDKGVVEYLAAARRVKALRPNAIFRLLGATDPNPTALSPAVLNQAIADGVVEYLGVVSDVRPVIAAASIFVLPSYREGLPRSTLEAMAMGRPVITTDVPGCRETVEAGVNGLLVPAKGVSELTNAMLQLIDNPGLRQRMGDAGRKRAVGRFSSIEVAQSVIDLLDIAGTI